METRYCIEYVNPLHPFLDNGVVNVRYDRVLTLEQAEDDLTLILSFGAKILNLYMGNVVDGKTGEWNPKPTIIDNDDWVTPKWLNSLKNERTNEGKAISLVSADFPMYDALVEMARWKEKQIFGMLEQLGYESALTALKQLMSAYREEEKL